MPLKYVYLWKLGDEEKAENGDKKAGSSIGTNLPDSDMADHVSP